MRREKLKAAWEIANSSHSAEEIQVKAQGEALPKSQVNNQAEDQAHVLSFPPKTWLRKTCLPNPCVVSVVL